MSECEGHPAGPLDPMGETVYCDGRCRRDVASQLGPSAAASPAAGRRLLNSGETRDQDTPAEQLRAEVVHRPVDEDELRARRLTRPAGNVDVRGRWHCPLCRPSLPCDKHR